MKRSISMFRLLPIAAACVAGPALATNGYFPHGYGMKAMGMGGASVAMAEDSLGGATNPAAMVWAGSRMDIGANVFMPIRDSERSGAGISTLNGKVDSDKTSFLVPEFGYNRMIGNDMSVGLTVYGNGGMNTTYPQGSFQCPTGPTTVAPANMLCGSGGLGVDLMQLIIAPTLAYKLNAQHAVGISLLLGYQRFKATGVQAFGGLSTDPANLTNNDTDSSTGVGVRLGYQGHLSDSLSIGASYAPKMNMGKFDKYKGLFAESGGFDIPSHYSIGVAFIATPAVTVAVDYERINYSDVKSVGNSSSLIGNCIGGDPNACLGGANGAGFGWQNINVFKLGLAWRTSEAMTWRAGYNKGDNPIRPSDVTFNILAPGVMKEHYTAGFTFELDKASEITGALMYAPRQTVTGPSLLNGLFSGQAGNETIGMKQSSIGLAWGHKF
jgi:long-chain fatty acid transport protein